MTTLKDMLPSKLQEVVYRGTMPKFSNDFFVEGYRAEGDAMAVPGTTTKQRPWRQVLETRRAEVAQTPLGCPSVCGHGEGGSGVSLGLFSNSGVRACFPESLRAERLLLEL